MGTLGWVVTERAQGACRDAGNVPFVGWILVSSMCSPSRNSPSHTLTMCLFFFFFWASIRRTWAPQCVFLLLSKPWLICFTGIALYLCFYRCGFNPWVRKIPWRREWQSTSVFLPGEFHGQRSLVGYSPWGHKESDMTERLHFLFFHFVS